MEMTLLYYLMAWKVLGYGIVFFGMIVEGETALFVAAFLTHQGFFDAGDMALIVLVGDSLWYELGRQMGASKNFFVRYINQIAAPFDGHLRARPFRTIFVSKFAYGFHHPILMRASFAGMTWKKFMKVDILATLLWIGAVGSLGYFSSAAFASTKQYLRIVEIGVFAAFVLFFVLEYAVTQGIKKKL